MDGSMRPTVVAQLGARIRAARQDLDLSVGALADRSAVSRRMLTQIELGQANPSVTILDRIAAGLDTTFAALMGVGADAPPDGVEVWSTEAGSWAVLLDAIDTAELSVETWKIRLMPGDEYRGGVESPSPGLMVHVVEGTLEIRTEHGAQVIAAGGSGRVRADQPYAYRATPGTALALHAVALMPRSGPARAT